MSDSRVTVKISTKTGNILNESSPSLDKNDLKELIAALRETQQKTNDCLTSLIAEKELSTTAEEKSDASDEEDLSASDDEDIGIIISTTDAETDVSPKRAKLKDN